MLHEDPGDVKYSDIGGLNNQIRELREVIELPLINPQLFLRVGIMPPKGMRLTEGMQEEMKSGACSVWTQRGGDQVRTRIKQDSLTSHRGKTILQPLSFLFLCLFVLSVCRSSALRSSRNGQNTARSMYGKKHRCQLFESGLFWNRG